MQKVLDEHRYRLASVFILSLTAFVIGLITIFISYVLIFYKNWPQFETKQCPNTITYIYASKIPIIQIIYTTTISIFILCLMVSTIISFIHRTTLLYICKVKDRQRIFYPFFLLFGAFVGIISLLYVIKIYTCIDQITGQQNSCLRNNYINQLNNKENPLIIILVLIAIMILLSLISFLALPYRYFTESKQQKTIKTNPPKQQQIKQLKQKNQQKSNNKVSKLQITKQQLLQIAVISNKKCQEIGVGDQCIELEINLNNENFYNIHISQQLELVQKVDVGVGCISMQTQNLQILQDILQKQILNYKVDSQISLLPPTIQRNIKPSSIEKIQRKNLHPTAPKLQKRFNNSLTLIQKSSQNYEEPQRSSKRLLKSPFKKFQIPINKDWGHQQLRQIDQRLNNIQAVKQDLIQKQQSL